MNYIVGRLCRRIRTYNIG